jgi:hypothetical protein
MWLYLEATVGSYSNLRVCAIKVRVLRYVDGWAYGFVTLYPSSPLSNALLVSIPGTH